MKCVLRSVDIECNYVLLSVVCCVCTEIEEYVLQ